MAENQEDRSREDLTEEASPYRIEEYRRKGMVAQSRGGFSSLAALFAAAITTYALTPRIGTQMTEFMREVFRTDLSARVDLAAPHIARGYLMKAIGIMIAIGLPISMAGFLSGIIASFAQVGTIFTFDTIQPDFSKVNPLQGIKRLVSIKQLLEGVKTFLKVLIVSLIAYSLIKTQVLSVPQAINEEPGAVMASFSHAAKVIFLSLAGVMAVFAAIDFGFQRWDYSKSTRMTKQEAKQEHREREGDPQIKARIRAVQREMARKRMMQAVKKADVIVTNPTHIAIALVYDKGSMQAPKVVAKGADFIAQKIKKIAAEAGVPLVENVPLARTLYKTVKVNQYIPRALYQAVAEVLAYVYRLKNRGL